MPVILLTTGTTWTATREWVIVDAWGGGGGGGGNQQTSADGGGGGGGGAFASSVDSGLTVGSSYSYSVDASLLGGLIVRAHRIR